MTDRLAALLAQFPVTARIFNTSALCGINDLSRSDEVGYLHLIRQGHVALYHGGQEVAQITEPSLLLYPLPVAHRFVTDPERGADFVCADLGFEGGANNPLVMSLPPFICLPLAVIGGAESMLNLLFAEAFAQNCGREAMLNRLVEIVLIQVLRHLMEAGSIQVGMLAGMTHPRLRMALIAMHEKPAHDWSLEELARQAGMSRSVLANTFRERVGSTPGAYLQRWRVNLAQRELLLGRSLKWVATQVGYGSEAALSRAFKANCGVSPRHWLAERRARSSG